ncbi:MAG: hypothetical protein ACRDFQ_08490 [Anaerolineales bacterium]
MLNNLLRGLAVIMLAFFVVLLPFSLLLHDVGELAFNPETTKSLVRDYLLRSELVATLAMRATQQMISGEPVLGNPENASLDSGNLLLERTLGHLTIEDWQEITDLAAPNKLVDASMGEVITAYSLWLDGHEDFPPLQINLAPWKQNLSDKAGNVMVIVLDSLPECTLDAAIAMSLEGLQSGESLAGIVPVCRPPEPLYSSLVDSAGFFLASSLELTPDRINLDLSEQDVPPPKELVDLRENLVRARLILGWGWLAVASIGIAAVALAARTFQQILLWSGWPLLIAGAGTFLLGLAFRFFTLGFVDDAFGNALGGNLGIAESAGVALVGAALDFASRPLLLQGLALSVLGIGSIFWARSLAQNNPELGIPINRRRIGL